MATYRPQALEQILKCKSFYLPPIPCSLPLKCHPDYISASKQATDWALRFAKVASAADKISFKQWKMPLYANFVVPWGDARHALVASKYTCLIAILDNLIDEEEPLQREGVLQAYMSLASGEKTVDEVPRKPVLIAQAEFVSEVRGLMSPLVFQRLVASYRDFVGCYTAKDEEEYYTQESYAKHRRQDFMVKPMLNFTQMCLGLELKDKDLESNEYLRMIDAMFDHIWLVNDLFSLSFDLQKRTFKNFLFLLLFTDRTVRTVQDAVDKVCAMIQEREREFKYYLDMLSSKAAESGNHDFGAYLEAVPTFLSGNLRFHYISSRFHGVHNPFVTGEPFSGTWLLHHGQSVFLPEYKPTHPYLLE